MEVLFNNYRPGFDLCSLLSKSLNKHLHTPILNIVFTYIPTNQLTDFNKKKKTKKLKKNKKKTLLRTKKTKIKKRVLKFVFCCYAASRTCFCYVFFFHNYYCVCVPPCWPLPCSFVHFG